MKNSSNLNFDNLLNLSQSLIGKKIFAEGWHYDNHGFMKGVITSVKKGSSVCVLGLPRIEIIVSKSEQESMNSYTFSLNQINSLLKNGKLPIPNQLLNIGTYAEINQ
jgi:hypothetical protein